MSNQLNWTKEHDMEQLGFIRIEAAGIVRDVYKDAYGYQFTLDVTENGRTTQIPCRTHTSLKDDASVRVAGDAVFQNFRHVYVNNIIPLTSFHPEKGYQKTEVIGRMTDDIRPASTPDGIKITNFVVDVYDGKNTTPIPCQAWRGAALAVENKLQEGHLVRLEGRTVFNDWKSYVDVKRFHILNAEDA